MLAYRASRDLRAFPTTWRVRLLLTSRVWEPERDTQVWDTHTDQMVGLAML